MIILNDTGLVLSLSENGDRPAYFVVLEPGEARDISFRDMVISHGRPTAAVISLSLPPALKPNEFEDVENG